MTLSLILLGLCKKFIATHRVILNLAKLPCVQRSSPNGSISMQLYSSLRYFNIAMYTHDILRGLGIITVK